MDDISLLDFGDPKTPQLSDMKKSTEMALGKGGFKLKQWTMSGDKKAQDIKYLSYIYHPPSDTFSCKVKVNFSKLRRGVREEKDIDDENELREYIEKKGLTRRNVRLSIAFPLLKALTNQLPRAILFHLKRLRELSIR